MLKTSLPTEILKNNCFKTKLYILRISQKNVKFQRIFFKFHFFKILFFKKSVSLTICLDIMKFIVLVAFTSRLKTV